MTQLWHTLQHLKYLDILRSGFDILVVAYLLYRLILLAKGRRAWQIIIGIGVFFAFVIVAQALKLVTVSYVLRSVTPLGPVAIVILLLPELRDVLERLGRLDFWGSAIHVTPREDVSMTLEKVVRTAVVLSGLKTGALMVLERETGLDDVRSTGTTLDSEVSQELLGTIFYEGTPLHDGAVVIRGNKIAAAGCRLPLSESTNIGTHVHMRHRAAIGLSENSDALTVIVSEETGTISTAVNGKLVRGLNEAKLRMRLHEAFGIAAPRRGGLSAALHLPDGLSFGRRSQRNKSTTTPAKEEAATASNSPGGGNTP